MSEPPVTRPSLLVALRDTANEDQWRQFVEIYTPLIFRHCMKHGLQEADAADVSQEIMKAVAQAMRKFEYDRGKGTFRSWLLTVTRSKLNNFFASRARHPQGTGETTVHALLECQPDPTDVSDWEVEFRRRLFEIAAARVRPECQEKTWQAFWRTAINDEPASAVAAALGLSVGAIYIARSRVLARLRQCVQSISEEGELIEPKLPGRHYQPTHLQPVS
ncbi:MAG: sigma-70 family RNA polymerase sigma factor [Verrucomicrobiota bacterium]